MSLTAIAVSAAAGLVAGFAAGYKAHEYARRSKAPAASRLREARRADADREAKGIVREAEIQARSEVLKAREAFELSVKEQRRELNETLSSLNKREQALSQREDNLDRKADVLDRKEEAIDRKSAAAEASLGEAKRLAAEAEAVKGRAEAFQQKLAGMTRDEARKDLFEKASQDIRGDLATFVRREKERAEKDARATAREVVLGAMQRYAAGHAADATTRAVPISGDDVKGRIIGREGRNIRALEAATGCSFLMDDTPDAVVITAADPIRREIAAVALEQLISSGRIQPQRIEDVVEQVRGDMDRHFVELGAAAAQELDTPISNADELRALGRLQCRTSFSQNVLQHSREVASYAGLMAAEMGLDEALARRVGLLHDIGKALDQTAEGPHALAGAEFLRACGEPAAIVDGVAGHHGETESQTVYAALASVADALSSARPGARSENVQIYLNRLADLEKIALSCPGVAKAYAVQAGHDLRVLVDPDKTDDNEAALLAAEICRKISAELQFPGQIRVTVIREKRCVEFAR